MSYKTWNGACGALTAPLAAVATGTSLKTMLQLATPSTRQIQVIAWGYTLSTLPGATATIELIQTDVAATVTAHIASGIIQVTDPSGTASALTLGTAATGYTASNEGSITATRLLDCDQIPTASGEVPLDYDYQFMPDERPLIPVSKFLRIRANTPTSGVNMLCWVSWNEV
jgi:hypothetical protein